MANLVSEAVKQTINSDKGMSHWKDTLQDILDKNLAIRANGNIASFGTQSDRAIYLFAFFKKLHGLGYKVEPQNLRDKHVKAVFEEYEREGLSAATMQKYISHLRQFAHWIGKGKMIGAAELYVKNKVSVTRVYMATEDKSLDATEIDKYEILQKIFDMDMYVGIQVLMQNAFGLRRKEAVCARPYVMERNGMITVTDCQR